MNPQVFALVYQKQCMAAIFRWYGNTMDYDQDAPRQVLCDWITNSGGGVAAFDFPTKGILQEAVRYTQYDRLRGRDGRAPGLLGWWPQRACTFIDNHDTGMDV